MQIDTRVEPVQRVLIVDDEVINLKVLSNLLRDEVKVVLAKSGEQAIHRVKECPPDLIILDVKMPGMDGFETLLALRQIAAVAQVPIIFITGMSDDHYEEKGLLLGAADYIFKPFHPGIVKARVHTHLQLARQRNLLEQLANRDSLTSLANRRYYKKFLQQAWLNASQAQEPISLAILDIDNFKQYNDHHGHDEGDKLLQNVSALLESHFCQSRQLISRFGGEEFVALMPGLSQLQARDFIGEAVAIVASDSDVTISAGGASCVPSDTYTSSDLFSQADKALYLAKDNGKNCVVWSSEYFA
ncbi:diguanylate cyclase domain-containing protein [Celerinatantimonas yamalensis]|uniref:diguanylate cyclase n=1 Tax=Celerinatantimonas yamalensis TaxID=559956 RepID=A0ABW9GB91_9GAMM